MKIIVAGDLVWDFNLVRQPRTGSGRRTAVPHTMLDQSPGGAWYLADLVRLACADKESDLEILTHAVLPEPSKVAEYQVVQSYSIWSRHQQVTGSKKGAWRIDEFLGSQEPALDAAALPIEKDDPKPDLLVIDDLALGFRSNPELWPAALKEGGEPERIVLKTGLPLAEGQLWEALTKRFLDRLTVVLPAAAMRASSASISRAFSWDQLIEQTVAEMETGLNARDLGRARGVVLQFRGAGAASFSRCRRQFGPPADGESKFGDKTKRPQAIFERLVYHPEELEGAFMARHPGEVFGATSILTAAVVRHELDAASYPLFLALGRGLAGVRGNQETGGGADDRFNAGASLTPIGHSFHPKAGEPAGIFRSAFPHRFLGRNGDRSGDSSDLLGDLTGPGLEYIAAKASEIVLRGAPSALEAAPKARYGFFLSVDRDEIERFNALRSAILSYQKNPRDSRPLSIAVFGPPGAGKSFAIKQLANELFGKGKAVIEFNLSQFADRSDLHTAFHVVRDASVKGQVPLVFWDEFDTGELRWLKDFLAPMQDAEFSVGGVSHPFGKAIFIFAGGTSSDFDSFDHSGDESAEGKSFRLAKGPDFVSRLRGFVNIKGPNPMPVENEEISAAEADPAHLIRRAIILRSIIERQAGHLVHPGTGEVAICSSVLRALLRVRRFLHGARSLESVVNMSALIGAERFGVAELPSTDQLRLHVTEDFMSWVKQGQIEVKVVEALAESCHEAWRDQRIKEGSIYGEVKDSVAKTHPLLRPYAELSEADKEGNRCTARVTQAKLLQVGFTIEPDGGSDRPGITKKEYEAKVNALVEIEHDIWLRLRLLEGYEWAPQTSEALRQSRSIGPFTTAQPEDQALDRVIVEAIPDVLERLGYRLVASE